MKATMCPIIFIVMSILVGYWLTGFCGIAIAEMAELGDEICVV